MKTARGSLLCVLLFSLCAVQANAKTKTKLFFVPADFLFNAAMQTAAANYEVTASDVKQQRFAFNTEGSQYRRLHADVSIRPFTERSSQLVLELSFVSWKLTPLSWAAGDQLADAFFADIEKAIAFWKPVLYQATMRNSSNTTSLGYADSSLEFVFHFSCTTTSFSATLDFEITNKTDSSLNIDWNKWAYVDPEGKPHQVLHKGIPYKDRDLPAPISTVSPGQRFADWIVPGNYIEHPLLPCTYGAARNYIGKAVSLSMPIEVNGSVKQYSFSFDITDVYAGNK